MTQHRSIIPLFVAAEVKVVCCYLLSAKPDKKKALIGSAYANAANVGGAEEK